MNQKVSEGKIQIFNLCCDDQGKWTNVSTLGLSVIKHGLKIPDILTFPIKGLFVSTKQLKIVKTDLKKNNEWVQEFYLI